MLCLLAGLSSACQFQSNPEEKNILCLCRIMTDADNPVKEGGIAAIAGP